MEPDDRGINESRGYACEIVAWRFVAHLSESETLDYLLHGLDSPRKLGHGLGSDLSNSNDEPNETTGLLDGNLDEGYVHHQPNESGDSNERDPTARFIGLNALEIAAVV